jgi:hypothetical protein
MQAQSEHQHVSDVERIRIGPSGLQELAGFGHLTML